MYLYTHTYIVENGEIITNTLKKYSLNKKNYA